MMPSAFHWIVTSPPFAVNGNPPVTGSTDVQWIMKKYEKDEDAVITKTLASGVVIQNATTGKIVISGDSADTLTLSCGRYYHELRYINASSKTTTIAVGYIDLKPTEEF